MSFLSKEGKTILELMKRGTLFYSNQMVPYMGSGAGRININIGNSTIRKRRNKSVRYSSRKTVRKSKRKSVRNRTNIRKRKRVSRRH